MSEYLSNIASAAGRDVPYCFVVRWNPDECDVNVEGLSERVKFVAERIQFLNTCTFDASMRDLRGVAHVEYHFYHSTAFRHIRFMLDHCDRSVKVLYHAPLDGSESKTSRDERITMLKPVGESTGVFSESWCKQILVRQGRWKRNKYDEREYFKTERQKELDRLKRCTNTRLMRSRNKTSK